jgi:LPLT family lysophospholipid transporter-like MFS transporter
MPKGFFYLVSAQFASGLADHALLILGIAFLSEQGYPGWWAPLLKFSFTLSYVLLAPVLGPLSDAVSKPRLMAAMNGLKLIGVGFFLSGLHPVLAFALVGLAASAYAPAKYGLVTETVTPDQLVRANGWLEVSVVLAVILGTACGGLLISVRHWDAMVLLNDGLCAVLHLPVQTQLASPLLWVILIYASAAALNWGIPHSHAVYAQRSIHPVALCRDFWHSNILLWRDPMARISLSVTTLFWGVGAVIQFAVLAWAQQIMHLPLEKGAFLQAIVAVGVIVGAGWAGYKISLPCAPKVLPLGIVLGLLLPAIAFTHSLYWAIPLMIVVGVVGGLLMVPMNAMLQHRGFELLTAGRSIAVQGFNENASVLLLLGLYSALLALHMPLVWVMTLLGVSMAWGMAALTWSAHTADRTRLKH